MYLTNGQYFTSNRIAPRVSKKTRFPFNKMRPSLILAVCVIVATVGLGEAVGNGQPARHPDTREGQCHTRAGHTPKSAKKTLFFGMEICSLTDLNKALLKSLVNFTEWAAKGLLDELKDLVQDLSMEETRDYYQNDWNTFDKPEDDVTLRDLLSTAKVVIWLIERFV